MIRLDRARDRGLIVLLCAIGVVFLLGNLCADLLIKGGAGAWMPPLLLTVPPALVALLALRWQASDDRQK